MKHVILCFLLVTLFTSCEDEQEGGVFIRLENISTYRYEEIKVGDQQGLVGFTDLAAGEFSGFEEFQLAYRYAYVELQIDGTTYYIQPIDFVGETPLSPGKYTYQISADDSTSPYGRISMGLVAN